MGKNIKRFGMVFWMVFLVSWPCAAGAAQRPVATPAQGITGSNLPYHIVSDRMVMNQKTRTVVFEGHVVVQQGNLTITGDQLTVYSVPPTKTQQQAAKSQAQGTQLSPMDRIDRIEIDGHVKITQQGKVATAEKAIYYHNQQKIVLMGHPHVLQGQDTITGRLITLYLQDNRSVVEGGGEEPVQAVIYPNQGK